MAEIYEIPCSLKHISFTPLPLRTPFVRPGSPQSINYRRAEETSISSTSDPHVNALVFAWRTLPCKCISLALQFHLAALLPLIFSFELGRGPRETGRPAAGATSRPSVHMFFYLLSIPIVTYAIERSRRFTRVPTNAVPGEKRKVERRSLHAAGNAIQFKYLFLR